MDNDEIGVAQHDLEVHIGPLRELDKIRRRVKASCESGEKLFERDIAKIFKGAFKAPAFLDEGIDIAHAAWLSGVGIELAQLQSVTAKAANSITLADLRATELSIERSGQLMQMLSISGKHALSRCTYLCWYTLIRELFSATAPDWSIGAARAGTGVNAVVSAYSTCHAIQGILCMARTLDDTARLIDEVSHYTNRRIALDNPLFPEAWTKAELARLQASHEVSIAMLSGRTILEADPKSFDRKELLPYLASIADGIKTALELAKATVKECMKQVTDMRLEEGKGIRTDRKRAREFDESESGHNIALSALRRTPDDIEGALKHFKAGEWDALAKDLRSAAGRIRNGISPARIYLRAVIDAQLGAIDGAPRDRNPTELALAAFAYAELTPPTESDRGLLKRAVARVCDELGDDGTLAHMKPYHTDETGVGWMVHPPYILHALARLANTLEMSIPREQASKVDTFFEHSKKVSRGDAGNLVGWNFDLSDSSSPDTASTGVALWALGAFQDLLNQTINRIILDHFSVREPDRIKLDLEALYYPDYGFGSAPKKINRESIAQQLQEMRRHIEVPEGKARKFSLALYGPAGTGKTTLVEALAKTCCVPMVEVTPSDIAKRGEGAIEQRARAVFEALSMLTRVVILFDEFDPVLKRRSSDDNRPFNMLSFLTPGMLPKLKLLHDEAKQNATAYVLITNLVGSLDEAAIREGRFDDKFGIFPPDPLSRYGQFLKVHMSHSDKLTQWGLANVIRATAGLGMTAMASREGWYRALGGETAKDTLIHCARGKSVLPKMPDPEECFRRELKGRDQHAEREYLEWGWLCDWEDACSDAWADGIEQKNLAMSLHEAMAWPARPKSQQALETREKQVQDLRK